MRLLTDGMKRANMFFARIFGSWRRGDDGWERCQTSSWKSWLLYGVKIVGACGIFFSIGLPVYLAVYTPLAWFDIVICTAGTLFISRMLLTFDVFYSEAEAVLWTFWARVTSDVSFCPGDHNYVFGPVRKELA